MSQGLVGSSSWELLRNMLHGDLKSLNPRIGRRISYPEIERVAGLDRKGALELVEQLWSDGYLDRSFHGMAYKCPHDGTTSLRPRLLCPKCEGEEVERERLIEHLGCGHVDMERNFRHGDGYVCPKDGKKLKLIGVDYMKAGIAYFCPTCNELIREPTLECVCIYANHTFHLDDAVQEHLYNYTLNEEGESKLTKAFKVIQPLADVFTKNGYEVSTFHRVTGASGISHLVDVYAINEMTQTTIISSILMEETIKPEEVLKLHAISLDINPTKAILIVVPELDPQSSLYADKLNVSVIQGEDFRAVERMLDEFIISEN